MILVTSANGKIGADSVAALVAAGLPVRAFVRTGAVPKPELRGAEIFEGDLFAKSSIEEAMVGVDAVFHISPPHHSGEFALGQSVIDAAVSAHAERVVLLSAIHPMLDALPSHRMKRMVEEYLVDSGLPYTILQPTMFMQNTDLQKVLETDVLGVPYSAEMPMSFVDRKDVAAIGAKVLSEPGHKRATYELIGTEPTSFSEAAAILSEYVGRQIVARQVPLRIVLASFPRDTAEQRYAANDFERMFSYYNRYGLTGNSNVLRWLLGRNPGSLLEYFARAAVVKGA